MSVFNVQGDWMFKPIARMAAAAVIAGLIVFFISGVPQANVADAKGAQPQPAAKSDRVAVAVTGAACSQRGWPEFERSCQFDLRQPFNQARTVRVLAFR
jgi:hypothetical protein